MGKLYLKSSVLFLMLCVFSYSQNQFYVYEYSGSPNLNSGGNKVIIAKGIKIENDAVVSLDSNSKLILVNNKGQLLNIPKNKPFNFSDLNKLSFMVSDTGLSQKYFAYVWRKFRNKAKYKTNYGAVFREFELSNLVSPLIDDKIYNDIVNFKWKNSASESRFLVLKDLKTNEISQFKVAGDKKSLPIDGKTLKYDNSYSWSISENEISDFSQINFFDFEIASQNEIAEFKSNLNSLKNRLSSSNIEIDENEYKKYFSQSKYKFPMGSDKEDDLYETLPLKAPQTESVYRNISGKSSLRKYTPKSKLQTHGTCVGWAVAYSARTTLEAQRNEWTDKELITKNSFSPEYFYRMIAPEKEDCNGANTSYAVSYLKDYGALPSIYWNRTGEEYFCPQRPIESNLIEIAKEYKIDEYARLFQGAYGYDEFKTTKVKLSLDNENPVAVSLNCPTSFHYIQNDLWIPTEDPKGSYGGHAVTVVAYDDNKYEGAFLIQNSWGNDYGDNGFVWVTYDDFNHFFYRALELVKLPKLEPEKPIYKGGLKFINLDTNEELEFSLAEKFRNWNTVLNNGENTYKADKPLYSGSRVRMYLKNNEPAFVYVLGTGSVNTSIANLFPGDNLALSAALNYEENEVALPTEDGAFVMDDTKGQDYMIMLFSRETLDIDNLKKQIASASGSFSKRLKTVLGDKLILFDDVEFEKNKIAFETLYKGDDNKIMALIIEFDHR